MLTYMEHVSRNNTTAKAAGSVSFADCYVVVGPAVMPALWADTCICLGLFTASPCMRGPLLRAGLSHVLTSHEHCLQEFRNIFSAFEEFSGK
jgi:hypothetical protein